MYRSGRFANNTVAPSNPEYVIAAYVQALQVGNTQTFGKVADPFLFQYVMLQTAGDGRYPILSQLGQIRDIIIQPESNAIGLTVQIQHELGTSEWQFMFGEARFALSSAYLKRVTFFNQNPYDYYTGGIFGGNNSLIRKPSAIWEQRTESSGSILGQLPGGGENYHTQSNLPPLAPRPPVAPTPPSATGLQTSLENPCVRYPFSCGAKARTFTNHLG